MVKFLICMVAGIYGLVWAVKHPCRSRRSVWVRSILGIAFLMVAAVPVVFMATSGVVRQDTLYDFQQEQMRMAYEEGNILEEQAGYDSLEDTLRYSGVWDDQCAQYWEAIRAAELNAQRQHLLAGAQGDTQGKDEYDSLAHLAETELRDIAAQSKYPENVEMIESWLD